MKKAVAFSRLIKRLTDQAVDAHNNFVELELLGRDTLEAEHQYDLALENLGMILLIKNQVYGPSRAWAIPAWAVEEEKGEAA